MKRSLVTALMCAGLVSATLTSCSSPLQLREQEDRYAASSSGIDDQVDPARPTIIIMDASSSMLYTDAPGSRLAAVKRAADQLLSDIPNETPLSLITFGDTVPQIVGDSSAAGLERSCNDVTTRIPLDSDQISAARSAISNLQAQGYTPIGKSLDEASRQLPSSGAATIILLSDGEDTCGHPDAVATARRIKSAHPDVTINTVGFKTDNPQLSSIADVGGGSYVTASNVNQLSTRLRAARATGASRRLSDTGLYRLRINMRISAIHDEYSDFPGLNKAKKRGSVRVITWRNCEWYFDSNDVLVGIRPLQDTATIDGLKAGSTLADATNFYGEPQARVDVGGGKWEAYYPAADGLTWKIRYSSTDGGGSGTIEWIELCTCKPPAGSSGSSANTGRQQNGSANSGANSDFIKNLPQSLANVEVPPVCLKPGGRLVNGELPGIPDGQGGVWITSFGKTPNKAPNYAVGDLNGDGKDDVVTQGECFGGGAVGWPPFLLAYDHQGKLLGGIELVKEPTNAGRPDVTNLKITNGKITASWKSGAPEDPLCCPSIPRSGVFSVRNGKIEVDSVN